jgi:hypothetical protein
MPRFEASMERAADDSRRDYSALGGAWSSSQWADGYEKDGAIVLQEYNASSIAKSRAILTP